MIKENNMNIIGRPNTIATYKSLHRRWIAGRTGEEIEKILFKGYIKPRTIVSIIRLIKKVYPEKLTENLEKALKYYSKPQGEGPVKSLTKVEASTIMGICKVKHPNFYPILLLALHGGLRRGEIFGLRWKDIDFLKGQVFINRSYDGPTKNGRSRKVPLSKELEKSLQSCYNFIEREDQNLFHIINPNPILAAICKEAGLAQRVTIHHLRHTFATLALDSGTNPKQVQVLLGHGNVSTTLNLYWSNIHNETDLSFLP